jgi:hypothetical protein
VNDTWQYDDTTWWVEPPGGALPAESEGPNEPGSGWSDHTLGVAAACGQTVVLCVEPERYSVMTYDDFVLAGDPCPGYTDGDSDGYCTIGRDLDADGDCTEVGEFDGPSDCADGDGGVSPGTPETCNGRDDDCDVAIDEGFDNDGDGWFCDDCDDVNPNRNPGLPEVCNGVDDDCNDGVDEGFDLDGDLSVCDDCDDTNAGIHPGAPEQCNEIDDDCNDLVDDAVEVVSWWPDDDGDGYGNGELTPIEDCAAPPGTVPDATDCDDGDPAIHPGADDPPQDGIDADCDGGDGDPTLPTDTWDTSDTGSAPEPPTDRAPADTDTDAAPSDVGCRCAHGSPGPLGLVPIVGLLVAVRRRARGSTSGLVFGRPER